MNSRNKGKRGEREACAFLREHGFTAERTVQYCGRSDDSSDIRVKELPQVHFEVKRCEKGNLYDWVDQAKRDAFGETDLTSRLPVVLHRKNDCDWVMIIPGPQGLELLRRSDLVEGNNGGG